MPSPANLEVVLCLQRLLHEAQAGRLRGVSFSAVTDVGLEAGWAGEHAGRRLVVVDSDRRILALDDPHGQTAKSYGVER